MALVPGRGEHSVHGSSHSDSSIDAELYKEQGDTTCIPRLGLCSWPPTQEGTKAQRGSQMSKWQG